MEYVREIAEKIANMEIRGAGKIARSAADALGKYAAKLEAESREDFIKKLEEAGNVLINSRPTAVSLPNAVRFIIHRAKISKGDVEEVRKIAIKASREFIEKSEKAVEKIGEIGAKRIGDGDTLLTHCNSKAALSVIRHAWNQGKNIKVFATESRPRYQGHITVRELSGLGIPTTLIVDSAVRTFIRKVDKVIVGADSIAANGAVVNKIGTSQIALAAHESRVLFFVAAETYKFHPKTLIGELVRIEERPPNEVANPEDFPGVEIRNPAFDVTPPEYVDLIITEIGVFPPQAAFHIIREQFGWIIGK